jgi:hypothetical protein
MSKIERQPYYPGVIFVDFDGCLSICNWRDAWLPKSVPKLTENYQDFHSLLSLDPPNYELINLVNESYDNGYKVIILTGRTESNRLKSENWLSKYNVKYNWLHMRKDGDYTPSEVYKLKYIQNFYREEVRMIFDDRQKIVDCFKENEYPVFKVVVRI